MQPTNKPPIPSPSLRPRPAKQDFPACALKRAASARNSPPPELGTESRSPISCGGCYTKAVVLSKARDLVKEIREELGKKIGTDGIQRGEGLIGQLVEILESVKKINFKGGDEESSNSDGVQRKQEAKPRIVQQRKSFHKSASLLKPLAGLRPKKDKSVLSLHARPAQDDSNVSSILYSNNVSNPAIDYIIKGIVFITN